MSNKITTELLSKTCPLCVQPKQRGKSFCAMCYFHLPKKLRSGLYNKYGQGYEKAYLTAKNYLREN